MFCLFYHNKKIFWGVERRQVSQWDGAVQTGEGEPRTRLGSVEARCRCDQELSPILGVEAEAGGTEIS